MTEGQLKKSLCEWMHTFTSTNVCSNASDTLGGELAEGVNLGGQEDSCGTLCSATELYTCIPHLRTHNST